jgi:uncharacterized membrane protein YoaK (UPF0700 family)
MPDVKPHRLTLPVLSAIAGFVDTAGFLALFGVFTAHVTGNLVVAGATVARERTDHFAIRLAVTPVFMVAVAVSVLVVRRLRARGRAALPVMLAIQLAALVVFMLLGVGLAERIEADAWALFAVGATGVFAMGLQNGAARILIGGAPTTIMTGNVTQLTIDLVDTVAPAGDDAHRREARARLASTAWLVLGFVAGAAAGAVLVRAVGLWCIGVPAAALAGLIAAEATL